MANINLIPWREERLANHQKRFAALSILGLIVGSGLLFLLYLYAKNKVINQNERNEVIQQQTKKIEKEIEIVNTLQKEREILIDRVNLIKSLQEERSEIVHVFDQLPQIVPGDLYFSGMNYKNSSFVVSGQASNNGEISNLMRNLDNSKWFMDPNLSQVVAQKGKKASKFDLTFKLEKNNKNNGDD